MRDDSKVIFDTDNKVLTIAQESSPNDPRHSKFLKFRRIPSTFKLTKHETGGGSQFHDVYEFRAKIYATEPRRGFDPNTKVIELICTLDYEL